MSLISEGLRKAHLEAQRQDREQRRRSIGAGIVDAPHQGGVSAALLMLAAALGGAVVVGAVSLRRNAPVPPVAPMQIVPAQPVPPVAASPVKTPEPIGEARSPVQEGKAQAAPMPAARPTSRRHSERPAAAQTQPREEREVSEPPALREAAAADGEQRTKAAIRHGFVDGETYASPISGPGGVEVTLSGISSVRGNSVAIMNGSIVRPGSTVGPFRVEAIERDRVLLRYLDVKFWIGH